jgi:hypothetical protein
MAVAERVRLLQVIWSSGRAEATCRNIWRSSPLTELPPPHRRHRRDGTWATASAEQAPPRPLRVTPSSAPFPSCTASAPPSIPTSTSTSSSSTASSPRATTAASLSRRRPISPPMTSYASSARCSAVCSASSSAAACSPRAPSRTCSPGRPAAASASTPPSHPWLRCRRARAAAQVLRPAAFRAGAPAYRAPWRGGRGTHHHRTTRRDWYPPGRLPTGAATRDGRTVIALSPLDFLAACVTPSTIGPGPASSTMQQRSGTTPTSGPGDTLTAEPSAA